jgi:hypothetical protein
VQIYDSFNGVLLPAIARLGLGVYGLIPDFKGRCPVCRGAGCAVRHGLYYRFVVDLEGVVLTHFPVPRFRCRRRGPSSPGDRTFSVLPVALVPRRRFSLPLMLQIVNLRRSGRSIGGMLDDLAQSDRGAAGALLIEEVAVYRVLSLLSSTRSICVDSTAVDRATVSGRCDSARREARNGSSSSQPRPRHDRR